MRSTSAFTCALARGRLPDWTCGPGVPADSAAKLATAQGVRAGSARGPGRPPPRLQRPAAGVGPWVPPRVSVAACTAQRPLALSQTAPATRPLPGPWLRPPRSRPAVGRGPLRPAGSVFVHRGAPHAPGTVGWSADGPLSAAHRSASSRRPVGPRFFGPAWGPAACPAPWTRSGAYLLDHDCASPSYLSSVQLPVFYPTIL
jgi:hypothetical protein